MITNGEIQLVINTPGGKACITDDSYLRKAAIKAKVAYMTTAAAAKAGKTVGDIGRCRLAIPPAQRCQNLLR